MRLLYPTVLDQTENMQTNCFRRQWKHNLRLELKEIICTWFVCHLRNEIIVSTHFSWRVSFIRWIVLIQHVYFFIYNQILIKLFMIKTQKLFQFKIRSANSFSVCPKASDNFLRQPCRKPHDKWLLARLNKLKSVKKQSWNSLNFPF